MRCIVFLGNPTNLDSLGTSKFVMFTGYVFTAVLVLCLPKGLYHQVHNFYVVYQYPHDV